MHTTMAMDSMDSVDLVDPGARRMEILVKDSLSSALANCSALLPPSLIVGPGEVTFLIMILLVLASKNLLMNVTAGVCLTGRLGNPHVQHLVPRFPTCLGHWAYHFAQSQNTGLECQLKRKQTNATNKQGLVWFGLHKLRTQV